MENVPEHNSSKGAGMAMNQKLMAHGKTELKIMNPLSHPVDFKLRCNAPEYYSAHRTSGKIGPQSSVTLRILLKEGFNKDSDDVHKFLIKVGHNELSGKKILFIEDDRKTSTDTASVTSEPSKRQDNSSAAAAAERKSGWMATTALGFLVSLSVPALLQWEGPVPARIVMSFVAGVSLAVVLGR